MKILILYKSKYGVTKKYAYWIHQQFPDSHIENIEIISPKELENFDTIIIGSNTYIGQIAALDFIVDNWNILQQKNVYVFTVGFFPPDSAESKKTYENIPEIVRRKIKYSKLPGTIKEEELEFFDKLIVAGLDPKEMEVKESNIDPIIEYIKSLEQPNTQ